MVMEPSFTTVKRHLTLQLVLYLYKRSSVYALKLLVTEIAFYRVSNIIWKWIIVTAYQPT